MTRPDAYLSFRLACAGLLMGVMLAAPALAQLGRAEAGPTHVIVGVDVSVGSPFISDDAFADKTARRIAERIATLPTGSKVSLRSFGAHSTLDTSLEIDRRVTRSNPAEATAALFQPIIAGLPKLARDGKIEAQNESNIVGFLQTVSRRTDCSRERTVIVLATDGVEESEFADLKSDKTLPAPEEAIFKDCARLEMLGVGRGHGSARFTDRLIKAWEAWAQAAGFLRFVGLDTW